MPPSSKDASAGSGDPPLPRSRPYEELYPGSLALLTDLYELTMAYGFFCRGDHEREAVFTMSFRDEPFGSGYAIACGLGPAIEFIERLRFVQEDLAFLAGITRPDGKPLFSPEFLKHLGDFRFRCDVDAVDEGSVVFAHTPLVRVRGPLLDAQLVESALLNIVNFQTLIATKAARVVTAAAGDPVLEFGLRRAQGIDGSISASRAAFIGGCTGTSNVLAGKLFDIPVAGTHAHSWVMAFEDELSAFEVFADAMPASCVLLVDTYDTLEGVRNAVRVGKRLRKAGHELLGVRLDSGDLAYLSIEARRILDAGGFPHATIYASNELDETIIESLKLQGAKIGAWGVGTRLVTGGDQASLGGTYKLTALRTREGEWAPRIKISEQPAKTSIPGTLQVRRFSREDEFVGDMIFEEGMQPDSDATMVDPFDPTRRRTYGSDCRSEDLLTPVLKAGQRVRDPEPLSAVRSRVQDQLTRLQPGVKRFINPQRYPVGLETTLNDLRSDLILRSRRA